MKKLVVLTGSGISSESGLKTFRESGGLWEDYDVMEVASLAGWQKNRELVLQFYNERRAQLEMVEPNEAHKGLVDLEKYFDVHIVTQNVDNLHERAGSKHVLHLHGILTRARSTGDPNVVYDIGYKPIRLGDCCEHGYQLRPDIVWFGEPVPVIEDAAELVTRADLFLVVGTSLVVYPAAGLINYVAAHVPVYLIDPHEVTIPVYRHIHFIREKAGAGITLLKNRLIDEWFQSESA
jgi:NAD-dependent deacetylase